MRAARRKLGLKDKEAETLSNIATLQFRLNRPDEALQAVKLGLKAIEARSNPDWQGPLPALSADIAQQQGRPQRQVSRLYLTAVRHARARGRAINCNRLLMHAGTQLLSHPDGEIRRTAERFIGEGMAWLQERGERLLNP